MPAVLRSIWAEPRVPDPPAPFRRDWALVAVFATVATLEAVLRDDLPMQPLSAILAVGLTFVLPFRRVRPLLAMLCTFGPLLLLEVAGLALNLKPLDAFAMFYVLLIPYALVRWGSGREIAAGYSVFLPTVVLGIARDYTTPGDAVAAAVFSLIPGTMGATVRYWHAARQRELETVKIGEREQLARELHDTVAHYVSAIAIRAQAGRLLAVNDPTAATDALAVIEDQASKTLAELRVMVGGLRDAPAALAPLAGLAQVNDLASEASTANVTVTVSVSGELDDVTQSVGTAVYRIAQESVTNAIRHARGVQAVQVEVTGSEDSVLVKVRDDGKAAAMVDRQHGFGLVGMAERAHLVGGTFEAGPSTAGGWVVKAVLPKVGGAQ